MSYLAGMWAGRGQAAGDLGHKLLDIHLKKVAGLSEMYKAMASNPNFHPHIQSEAANRAATLAGAGPFDFKTPKKLANFKDLFEQAEQLETQNVLGNGAQGPPSIYFKGVRDPNRVAQADLYMAGEKARIEHEARTKSEMDLFRQRAEMLGVTGGSDSPALDEESLVSLISVGVPPDSTLGKMARKTWAYQDLYKRPRERMVPQTSNGQHAVSFLGGVFDLRGEPVDPNAVRGDLGSVSSVSLQKDEMGFPIGQVSRREPIRPGGASGAPVGGAVPPPGLTPAPAPFAAPAPASAPAAAAPMVAAPPASPGAPVQPAPAGGPVHWIDQAIPGTDQLSMLAKRYAATSEDATQLVIGRDPLTNRIQQVLERASIWVPSAKVLEKLKGYDLAKHPVQLIGSSMQALMDNPTDVTSARVLHGQIMSFGSLLAKGIFEQTGILSNQEQQWARMIFAGTIEAIIAGGLEKAAGWNDLTNAAKQNMESLALLLNLNKQTAIQGGADRYKYIAGHGPVADFIAPFDPMAKPGTTAAPPKLTPEQQRLMSKMGLTPQRPAGAPTGPVTEAPLSPEEIKQLRELAFQLKTMDKGTVGKTIERGKDFGRRVLQGVQ